MVTELKKGLGINVLSASKQRVAKVFDDFPRIYVSFSGGKDSTCMLHLVMAEAIKRRRKVGVLFVDLEGQYKLTITHILECFELYKDYIEPYWVCLPIHLRNAVSQYQPHWICWDKKAKDIWIRKPPKIAITEDNHKFSFFKNDMEFEEFVPAFGKWYAQGKLCACFVGIRSDESLNRFRTMMGKKSMFENLKWTTWCGETLYNIYPIYDWKTKDIWTFLGKEKYLYNKLYDRMYQAGLTIHQMRICQPYGDDQKRGLWLFHIIEPETLGKIVQRVNGSNSGALYSQDNGNITGHYTVTKPKNHTWESFAKLLLGSMPKKTKEHFENKIAVFLKWYCDKGYNNIPDDGPLDKTVPSWKRVCKALLRNDYWCKGLSFSQQKSTAYDKYLKLMKKRRQQWKLI